jgi:hypothetical protein
MNIAMLSAAAQQIFFEAMCFGYAMEGSSGAALERTTITELPGSKVITSNDNDWKLIDCYYTRPDSEKSGGQTMIWYKGVPVWMMAYGGRYPKVVIPFLKQCLHRAYMENRFYGGRGPEFVQGEQYTYVNRVHGTFSNFKGEERIYDRSETRFGHHWYHGMSLLRE